jgi:8-oxo-dGTP pyrophosphatase MutT (NUDIX family)
LSAFVTIGFDDSLRAQLASNLDAHERRAQPLEGRRHAAVAVVIVDSVHIGDAAVGEMGGAAFLLCLRPMRMSRHAGQYALPGGRIDAGETPLDAALRELEEELGICLGPESVVGWLDDYLTRSGYLITPVVLWGGADPAVRPAPDEVYAVYRISLQTLIDAEPRFIPIPQSDRPVLQLPLGNELVHAPTGAVLWQLRQVGLLGRIGERVEGIEEPVFAWT